MPLWWKSVGGGQISESRSHGRTMLALANSNCLMGQSVSSSNTSLEGIRGDAFCSPPCEESLGDRCRAGTATEETTTVRTLPSSSWLSSADDALPKSSAHTLPTHASTRCMYDR